MIKMLTTCHKLLYFKVMKYATSIVGTACFYCIINYGCNKASITFCVCAMTLGKFFFFFVEVSCEDFGDRRKKWNKPYIHHT